jgi:hypothetical protein
MKDARHLILLAALLLPAPGYADMYKCTDSAGRVSYSDKPCPASGEQESMKIATDPAEGFLGRVTTLALKAGTNNPDQIEKILSIKLQVGEDGRRFWVTTTPSASLPAQRIALTTEGGRRSSRDILTITIDNNIHCIRPPVVNRALRPAFNTSKPIVMNEHDVSSDHQRFSYELNDAGHARQVLTTDYRRRYDPRARNEEGYEPMARAGDFCLEQLQISQ